MSRKNRFATRCTVNSLFQCSRPRRNSRHRNAPAAHRTARFEPLEPRQMLAVDLGFAGAFSLINSPSDTVYSQNAFTGGLGGGLVTDAAGNRYVTLNNTFGAGAAAQNVDLDPGPGVLGTMMEAGVVKLDPNNNVVWTAPLKGTNSPSGAVVRTIVSVDANQNVYLAGEFRGTVDIDPGPGVLNITSTSGGADYGYYLAKLNSAGQLQWVRTLASSHLSPYRITVDNGGNILVANNFYAPTSDPPLDVDPGPGQTLVQQFSSSTTSMMVLKYSTNGDFVWERQFGGTAATTATLGIAASPQNDVYVTGRFTGSVDLDPGAAVHTASNNGSAQDAFLIRLNSSGNFVWADATSGTNQVSLRGIEFPSDGSIIVSGGITGTVNFQTALGNVPITADLSSGDAWVFKINSDSSVAWVKQFGGYTVLDSDLDQAGNIYLGGRFNVNSPPVGQAYDFDPGPGVYNLFAPSTYSTAYVASLTSTGDFRWAVPLGGNTGSSELQGLSVTPNGDVQVSGVFRGTGDFDPNPATAAWLTTNDSSNGNQVVFTATLKQTTPDPGAPVVDAGQNQTILVTGPATLDGTVADDGLPGHLATTWSLQSGPGTVSFADASAVDTTATFSTIGTYLLKLEANDGQFTTADYVTIVVNPVTATLTAIADTYLDNGSATTNFGTSATLAVSGKPDDATLLKWDLSSIPAGSTLQSAKLSLNVTGASANTYEIYELKRSWTESQATWKKATSAVNWQTAGADGAMDRSTTVLGTVTASATGILNVTLNAAGLAVVQGWVNSPATNFGFVLQDYDNANKDDLVFSSRESTVAANRPQLQVVYNPPSPPPMSRAMNQVSLKPASLASPATHTEISAATKSHVVPPSRSSASDGQFSDTLTVLSRAVSAALPSDPAPSTRTSDGVERAANHDAALGANEFSKWPKIVDEMLSAI